MKKLKKIIIGIFFLVLVIVLSLYLYLRYTLPPLEGQLKLPGLKQEVRVKRNNWGVPLIEAKNREDMFFALGFVHGQDRMFQMDLTRRLATGRLSEVMGPQALEIDTYHKTLLIEEAIEKSLTDVPPEIAVIIDAYCRGVNAFIETQPLPFEFKVLGYRPAPWETADVLSVFKNMEIILADSGSELTNLRLIRALGSEWATPLFSGVYGGTIIDALEIGDLQGDSLLSKELAREAEVAQQQVGSNNWVIAGIKTASGAPILANDPHLSNVFPSYFYQVLARDGDLELSGNTIAGVPLIVIGRNQHVGWGFTNVGTDVIDYFILELNPENTEQYRWDEEWVNFEYLDKRIKIKDQPDHHLRIKMSKLGPVRKLGNHWVARHSLGLYGSTVLEAFYEMNTAENSDDFLAGVKKFSSPAQNVVFADKQGNIGYFPAGKIPIRGKGNGEIPQIARGSSDVWQGFFKEDEKPYLFNPAKGYVVTANNPVLPDTAMPIYAKTWIPSFRADRIDELISKENKITPVTVQAVQTDSYLKNAEFLLAQIKNFQVQSPGAKFVMEQFEAWDLRAHSGIAPYLFYRFEARLADLIFKDHFKEEKDWRMISPNWIYKIMGYPESRVSADTLAYWFDKIDTKEKESFEKLVAEALEATYEEYKIKAEKSEPTWDKLHTLYYQYRPLGYVSIFKPLVNRGPFAMKGGKNCVLTASFKGSRSFEISHLSTFRMIMDFSDFSKSLLINSSGQSGHFMSPHFEDQIEPYINLEYRDMESFTGKLNVLKLSPRQD